MKGGDTEVEELEGDEELEDPEKEVIEELRQKESKVIRVEKRGERLYKIMNEFLDRFIPEERDALREYIDREIAPLERQLLAEHLRILIPHFHAFIGFLIKGGVSSENREAR